MKTDYKGYEISYNETRERFQVEIGDTTYNSAKLGDLKKRIDVMEKAERKFDRIDVLCEERYGVNRELHPGQITSVAEVIYGNVQVWVSVNKQRSKRSLKHANIYLNTKENRAIYEHITSLGKDIGKIEDQRKALYNTMEKPVIKDEDLK